MNDSLTPLVSVVIPSYNHARYISRALQSVLNQTYTNCEVIVIDNHSTDNTDEVMASFTDSRITYLKIHNNGIIAASRNAGIRAAKGEWIAFLDSDDWWTVDKLQVSFNNIDDNVDLFYHDLEIVSNRRSLFGPKKLKPWQVKPPVLMDLLLKGNAIPNSSVLVRRNLLEKIGGINESPEMIAAEDYNAWLRIAKITNKFVCLQQRLGFYLVHNQGVSQKDMSVSVRCAVSEFLVDLSEQQKLKLEVSFNYKKGRFNYEVGNYAEAKSNMLFCMKHGSFFMKLKSMLFLALAYEPF